MYDYYNDLFPLENETATLTHEEIKDYYGNI
jgi:hypothetical protein